MAYPLRYIPPRSLVEVTTRTIQGRFLLRPSRDLNEIVIGIVARAATRYEVAVVDFKVLSNHMHLLLVPRDAEQLAAFMNYLNGNLAREAGRLHGWRERFWGRRYRAIVVSDEPDAQVDRLRYLLSQGCKEGLVRSPRDWPGASATDSLLTGKPLCGWWFDRTAEYQARQRGESYNKYSHGEEQRLELAPLPCWGHLAATDCRRRVAELVAEIEAATRRLLEEQGRSALGPRRILSQDPHMHPERPDRAPAPRFHAATAGMRRALEIAYYEFRIWYGQAAEDLRRSRHEVEFPPGSFPPRLPFAWGRPP
jgi:REP element-mobilizing transposase RayT